ncbi:DUF6392 family protein [Enterobacter mori]|uniref:DUF6392 family protein n=1 Tax=Enterobacter mori TaxID=539813 RepID=UPI0021B0FEBE|nr:DUF6392 family protein [Enterobacter mori]MCT6664013.1 DUF6392 family protein [Enterobacter mori]
MTVNVEVLIHSLGKSYSDLRDAELIPYKTPPTGFSGAYDISLDMALEGVYLSFKREGRILQDVILNLQRPEIKNWDFPNELPFGLEKNMTLGRVHAVFGEPIRSMPPKVVMKRDIGRADLYAINGLHIPVSMQIRYDMNEVVQSASFFPTSELRW